MQPAGRQICRFSPVKSEDLIEIYRRSNRAEDFEQIVRRFAALVLCECRRVTGNIYDAEDASQLVFLALAMEIKSGTDILSLGAWLKRVSRRQALKIVRSRTRRKRREDAVRRSELHLVDTDYPLDQAVIAGIIRDAIDQLPERYRMAVVLHYFGGMTLELIAVELKITKQAVGTRLHRGRKMLAEKLNKQGVKLSDAALAGALAVVVPAAVVAVIVRSSTTLPLHTTAAATIPLAMTHLLQAIGAVAIHKPLRVAVMVIALGITTSGLALVVDRNYKSLPQINTGAAVQWLQRLLKKHRPQFNAPVLERLSDASGEDLPAPYLSQPDMWKTEPLAFDATDVGPRIPEQSPAEMGSNAPLAFVSQAAGAFHRAPVPAPSRPTPKSEFSLAQPELAPPPPVFAPGASARPRHRDWAAPKSLQIAKRADESEDVRLPAGANRLPKVDVGVAGTGALVVGPEATLDTDEIRIGVGGGSSGAVALGGGQINTNRMIVGDAGAGSYRQRKGQLNTRDLLIGNRPGSSGEVRIDSGAVSVRSGPQVGVHGTGKLFLGSRSSPGVIRSDGPIDGPMIVRANPGADGLVQGWGTVSTGGTLINNGRIVADGYGASRTLDLSAFGSITSTIENPVNGTNGWYAQNGGRLLLPPVTIDQGTNAYTWGESNTDPTIDLVNSVRFTVRNQPKPTAVSIALASASNVQGTPLVLLQRQVNVVSYYQIQSQDLSWSPGGVVVSMRYGGHLHGGNPFQLLGGEPLQLFAFSDSTWTVAQAASLDSVNSIISGEFAGGIRYLAVGTITAEMVAYDSAASAMYVPLVPEPSGLVLSVGALALLATRKSRWSRR